MRIVNARVFSPEGFVEQDLYLKDGFIADIAEAPADEPVFDAQGCMLAPGYIDIHFHGCMGFDFCDGSPEALHAIASYEASRGVTAICPATMTYSEAVLSPIMKNAQNFVPEDTESALVGINMEGPFISPNKIGAQNPEHVQHCDVDMFRRLQDDASGLIKIVDVAPEEPCALEFIEELKDEVRISLAHTIADYDCACHAFRQGASHLTHCYNAMPGLHHRKPGPIPAAVEYDKVTPELIADGVHIHPAMVRLAFKMFGDDRVILISDSMMATGLEDGTYSLGGQEVFVSQGCATLASGTIAGSTTDLGQCVSRAITQMNINPVSAIKAATINPAKSLGIDKERGSLEIGKIADVLVLDEHFNPTSVFVRGRLIA